MDWYYSKNGAQQGPLDLEEMRRRVADGSIAPSDLVWHENMADWTPAAEVDELRGGVVSSGGPVAAAGAPAAAVAGVPGEKKQGLAVASMVCGIIALLGSCMWCMGLPLGLAAVITGHISRSQSRAGRAAGGGMARAGLITGYLAIVLAAIFAALNIWLATATEEDLNILPAEVREQILQQRETSGYGLPGAQMEAGDEVDMTPMTPMPATEPEE